MPRRKEADDLTRAVGERIRQLRQELGLTLQELADGSKIGSKGHVSNVERGLVRPNVETLKRLADGLGVLPLDLLTFPKRDRRQKLVDLTRKKDSRRIADAIRVLNASGAR